MRAKALSILLLLSWNAHAQESQTFKPQVQPGTQITPAGNGAAQPLNPVVTPAGASGPVAYTGQPIRYPMNPISAQEKQDQDSQALMDAFGKIMSGLGLGGSPTGERSEFANSGDDGGYSGSSGMTPIGPNDLNAPYKIVPPFRKWFEKCTKGMGLGECRFENMGIKGDPSHQARRSCHNSLQAIDVGTITCSGGQKISPKDSRFFDIAYCMANDSQNELQVIFHKASGPNMIQKSDHSGHMHVQLKGCAMVYGSGN